LIVGAATAVSISLLAGLPSTAKAQTIYRAGPDLKAAELNGGGLPTRAANDLINSVWDFGTSSNNDGVIAFAPYPDLWHTDTGGGCCAVPAGDAQGWEENPDVADQFVPFLFVNTTANPLNPGGIFPIGVDAIWAHSGQMVVSSGDHTLVNVSTARQAVRWVAPGDGVIDIDANWFPRQAAGSIQDGIDVHVMIN